MSGSASAKAANLPNILLFIHRLLNRVIRNFSAYIFGRAQDGLFWRFIVLDCHVSFDAVGSDFHYCGVVGIVFVVVAKSQSLLAEVDSISGTRRA
jgi:hypothetical protein